MRNPMTRLLALGLFCTGWALAAASTTFDVKAYGATGDGKTLDTDAINKAIEAANAAGGGMVFFPAGTYASYSIHLKSNVALYLDTGEEARFKSDLATEIVLLGLPDVEAMAQPFATEAAE